MATFNELWQLLYDHGSTSYYKHDCAQLWESLTPTNQQALFDRLSERLQKHQYVAYNPLDAMRDNLPRRATVRTQTLSYNEYYSLYRTTTPKDGWQMQKDANGKVFYSKTAQP